MKKTQPMVFNVHEELLAYKPKNGIHQPTPAVYYFNKKPRHSEPKKTTVYNISNSSIPFSNQSANWDSSLQNWLTSLFSILQKIDRFLSVLPLNDKNQPALLSGPSFPIDDILCEHYLSEPKVASKLTTIHLYL